MGCNSTVEWKSRAVLTQTFPWLELNNSLFPLLRRSNTSPTESYNTCNLTAITRAVIPISALTFNETMNAFLAANKEGFRLSEVDAAPLAQRRRLKNKESEDSTPGKSTDSGGSGGSGHVPARKRKLFPVPEEVRKP